MVPVAEAQYRAVHSMSNGLHLLSANRSFFTANSMIPMESVQSLEDSSTIRRLGCIHAQGHSIERVRRNSHAYGAIDLVPLEGGTPWAIVQ